MMKYELTVVLPGGMTTAKKKNSQEAIEKIVKTFGGKVVKLDEWGKKDLAYKIEKNDSGIFLHYILELKADSVKMLSQKLNLEEGVIRYLLVKGGKDKK